MHDANDVESLDDDFYSGETEDAPMDYYSDYDDDADDYFDDGDDSDRNESRRSEVSYHSSILNFVLLCLSYWQFVLFNVLLLS